MINFKYCLRQIPTVMDPITIQMIMDLLITTVVQDILPIHRHPEAVVLATVEILEAENR